MTTSITHLADQIIFEGKTLPSCSKSMINHCYRGKGDHPFGGNYGSLKLLDQVLKIIERVVDSIIRSLVKIDELQFGFQPVRKTTNAIFILRQINQKHFAKYKLLHFAFVDILKRPLTESHEKFYGRLCGNLALRSDYLDLFTQCTQVHDLV